MIIFVKMKHFLILFILLGAFSFGQVKTTLPKDSISVQKFDLKRNSDSNFTKFDLNLKIKSWDEESWEEKQMKRQRYEHLEFPNSLIRQTLDGIVEGMLNRLISKK